MLRSRKEIDLKIILNALGLLKFDRNPARCNFETAVLFIRKETMPEIRKIRFQFVDRSCFKQISIQRVSRYTRITDEREPLLLNNVERMDRAIDFYFLYFHSKSPSRKIQGYRMHTA